MFQVKRSEVLILGIFYGGQGYECIVRHKAED